MKLKCAQCGQSVDGGVISGGSIICPHCEARLTVPTPVVESKLDKTKKQSPAAIVMPVIVAGGESPELNDEKKEDMREARGDRQELRKERGEDRQTNGIGAFGFAIGLTTVILLFSAGGAHREFPAFLLFASCFGIPMSILGLICSIIGALRKGRSKIFSLLGIAIGAFLLIAAVPAAFVMLKKGP